MTTAFLFIALVILIGLTSLLGGALFVVGLFRKNRTARRTGTILFISSLFGLAGCFTYASAKVFHKLKEPVPNSTGAR